MSETSSRLLTLLSLLQARRDWAGGELADRLEVSRRTIRRDVERLRKLGYPIESLAGPAGGYRLEAGTAMPPLLLDDEEAVAIAVGLRTAAGASVAGIEDASLRALVKLEQVLPSRLRPRLRALQGAETMFRTGGPMVDPQCLTVVGSACRESERIRFAYRDREGNESRRDVDPHTLVSTGRRWYLVAWDHGREDWRTFRVDRIARPAATGVRAANRELPAKDAAALRHPEHRGDADPLRGEGDPEGARRGGAQAPLVRMGPGGGDRRGELRVPDRGRRSRLARPPRRDARGRVRGPRAARAGRAPRRTGRPRRPWRRARR